MIERVHREKSVAGEGSERYETLLGCVVAGVAVVAFRIALDPVLGSSISAFAALGVVAAAFGFAGFAARRRYAQARAAARDRQHLYTAVFDSSPFALALIRIPRGSVVETNDALLRLCGYRRDEVVGRTTVALGITPAPAYAAMTWELQRGGSVRDFECVRRTPGGIQTFAISMERVTWSGEGCAVVTIRDITDQRRIEDALRKAEPRIAAQA